MSHYIAFELEANCITCESGVYLVKGDVDPPDGPAHRGWGVEYEPLATASGDHAAGCAEEVLVSDLVDDALEERAISWARSRA